MKAIDLIHVQNCGDVIFAWFVHHIDFRSINKLIWYIRRSANNSICIFFIVTFYKYKNFCFSLLNFFSCKLVKRTVFIYRMNIGPIACQRIGFCIYCNDLCGVEFSLKWLTLLCFWRKTKRYILHLHFNTSSYNISLGLFSVQKTY